MSFKRIGILFILLAFLSGCTPDGASTPPDSSAAVSQSDITEAAEPSPSALTAPTTPTAPAELNPPPLLPGEMLLHGDMSVNEIVEQYGPYISADVYADTYADLPDPKIGYTIYLYYKKMELELFYFGTPMSFTITESGDSFEAKGYTLSEKDKKALGFQGEITIQDPNLPLLRGIQIGDSFDSVKSKFLDCSADYLDIATSSFSIVYTREDMPWDSWGLDNFNSDFKAYYSNDFTEYNRKGIALYGEERLEYFSPGIYSYYSRERPGRTSMEVIRFYFKDKKLITVTQSFGNSE